MYLPALRFLWFRCFDWLVTLLGGYVFFVCVFFVRRNANHTSRSSGLISGPRAHVQSILDTATVQAWNYCTRTMTFEVPEGTAYAM